MRSEQSEERDDWERDNAIATHANPVDFFTPAKMAETASASKA
jgi:hypothetical protein